MTLTESWRSQTKIRAPAPLHSQGSPRRKNQVIHVLPARAILLSLRRHRATRDERAAVQDRVVRGSPCTRWTYRIAGIMLCPGFAQVGRHDRQPIAEQAADRRQMLQNGADRQSSGRFHAKALASGSQRRGDEPQCLRTTRVGAEPRRCSSPKGSDVPCSLTSLVRPAESPLVLEQRLARASPLGIVRTELQESDYSAAGKPRLTKPSGSLAASRARSSASLASSWRAHIWA